MSYISQILSEDFIIEKSRWDSYSFKVSYFSKQKKRILKQQIFLGQVVRIEQDEVIIYSYDIDNKSYELRSFEPEVFNQMDLKVGDIVQIKVVVKPGRIEFIFEKKDRSLAKKIFNEDIWKQIENSPAFKPLSAEDDEIDF